MGRGDEAQRIRTVVELVLALSVHDRASRGHSERVRVFTDLLADELKVAESGRNRLRWAALLHDIGKLEVSPVLLAKPDKPNEEEWALLHRHPETGARLIAPLLPWLGEWGLAVVQHHERFDGTGYPNQLSGNEISMAARIVSVADVYEVMTAPRTYKLAMSVTAARAELVRVAGTELDPVIVRAFLNISVGRLRRTIGFGAWIGQIPTVARLLSFGSWASSGIGIAAAAGATVLAVAGVAGPPPAPTAPAPSTLAVGMAPSPHPPTTSTSSQSSSPTLSGPGASETPAGTRGTSTPSPASVRASSAPVGGTGPSAPPTPVPSLVPTPTPAPTPTPPQTPMPTPDPWSCAACTNTAAGCTSYCSNSNNTACLNWCTGNNNVVCQSHCFGDNNKVCITYCQGSNNAVCQTDCRAAAVLVSATTRDSRQVMLDRLFIAASVPLIR
jgi:hypothetical protein